MTNRAITQSPTCHTCRVCQCVGAIALQWHRLCGTVAQSSNENMPETGNERVSLQYNSPLLLHNNCTFPVHIIIIRNFRHTNYAQALPLLCHTPLLLLNGLCVILCGVTMVKVLLIKKEIMSLHFFGLWIIKKKT